MCKQVNFIAMILLAAVSAAQAQLTQPRLYNAGPLPEAIAAGGSGWGENAIADKIGHDWRNLETYDSDDGSVVDW